MADQRAGGIAWTDQTWNPIRGCSRVSEGCRFCYAEAIAARFSRPGQAYNGLATMTPQGPRWTGEVRLVEEHLADPLSWESPCRVFVNSMSDLFHEKIPDAWIDRIFAVMALAGRHTFQVLTKRPERMLAYMNGRDRAIRTKVAARAIVYLSELLFGYGPGWEGILPKVLPNVWLGVSVEDQATADDRIPFLLQTPAAVRFVSYEPALSAVDFSAWMKPVEFAVCGLTDRKPETLGAVAALAKAVAKREWPGIDLVIVGGESGPRARPLDLAWARSTVEQCRAAKTAVFVKQLGSRPVVVLGAWPHDSQWWVAPFGSHPGDLLPVKLRDRKGEAMEEWPDDLRIREMPGEAHG